MAKSPSHKFGQIIGDVFEATIEPLLREFAQEQSLYLDRKGPRPAREGRKVCWTDLHGNTHDLDFVLERGGSKTRVGTPLAFIETAWRRYTRHSRNKAQEIQGAIIPLVSTYQDAAPFVGAVLAGDFTEGAINQLESLGFAVLYFPYDTVVAAFREVGVDAGYDEGTPDAEFAEKVRAWEALPEAQRVLVSDALLELNSGRVKRFMHVLRCTTTREIELVRVIPLHGRELDWPSVREAIAFIKQYNEDDDGSKPVVKYEIEVRYNNGDRIVGEFQDKLGAIQFLSKYQRPSLQQAE